MGKQVILKVALGALLFLFFSFTGATSKVKCMVQMTNYDGEGAYVVVSVINAQNKYVKTLYVFGDDDEWFYELTEWWKFYGRNKTGLDGITGETLAGGERALAVFNIDSKYVGKGYKLRFETAVEGVNYYKSDIDIELTSANLQKKFNGSGFIRYVRLLPQ